jgi:hypothetical protein
MVSKLTHGKLLMDLARIGLVAFSCAFGLHGEIVKDDWNLSNFANSIHKYKISDNIIKASAVILANNGTDVHLQFQNPRVIDNNPTDFDSNGDLSDTAVNSLVGNNWMLPTMKLRLLVSIRSTADQDDGKSTTLSLTGFNGHGTADLEAAGAQTQFSLVVTGPKSPVGEYVFDIEMPIKWIHSPLSAPIAQKTAPVLNELTFSTLCQAGEYIGTKTLHADGYLGFGVTAPIVFIHGANDCGKVWYVPQDQSLGDQTTGVENYLNIMDYFSSQTQAYVSYSTNINLGFSALGYYSGAGTLTNNAKQLISQLQSELARFGATHANLICHSKGGLDARKMISLDGYKKLYQKNSLVIDSISTISSPHWGSALADSTLAYLIFHQVNLLGLPIPEAELIQKRIWQLTDELGFWKKLEFNIVSPAINTIKALTTSNMATENALMKTDDSISNQNLRFYTIVADADINSDGYISRFEGAGEPGFNREPLSITFNWPFAGTSDITDYSGYYWINNNSNYHWSDVNDYLDTHYQICKNPGWTLTPNGLFKPWIVSQNDFGLIKSSDDVLNDCRVAVYSGRYKSQYQLGVVRKGNHIRIRNESIGSEIFSNILKTQQLQVLFIPES